MGIYLIVKSISVRIVADVRIYIAEVIEKIPAFLIARFQLFQLCKRSQVIILRYIIEEQVCRFRKSLGNRRLRFRAANIFFRSLGKKNRALKGNYHYYR